MQKRCLRMLVLTLLGALSIGCAGFSGEGRIEPTESPRCLALPQGFSSNDLVGTWVAKYFGGLATDTLVLREDGSYKQVYRSDPTSFESGWQDWSFEYHPSGYGLLHLEGMRRCDDISPICDEPGGGLPDGELAINQCEPEYLSYSGEVILLVVGMPDRPLGFRLQHARLAGSDWFYTFELEE